MFESFTGKFDEPLRYYQWLAEVLSDRRAPLTRVFDAAVARIHELANES